MKVKYVSIFAVVLVLMSGIPLFSGPSIINNASARYSPTNTQTEANTNECTTGTNCAVNSPQTQGDGSAWSPTNLQISGFDGEQPPTGPGASLSSATVRVFMSAICPEGVECPNTLKNAIGSGNTIVTPTMFTDNRDVLVQFPSAQMGFYAIFDAPPDIPEGLTLSNYFISDGCGPTSIGNGEVKQCVINYTYVKSTPPTP